MYIHKTYVLKFNIIVLKNVLWFPQYYYSHSYDIMQLTFWKLIYFKMLLKTCGQRCIQIFCSIYEQNSNNINDFFFNHIRYVLGDCMRYRRSDVILVSRINGIFCVLHVLSAVDWVAGTGRAAAVCATGVSIWREQWWDSRPQFSHAPRRTCTREPKRVPTGCRFWSPPVIVSGPRRCTPRQYRSTRVYRHRRHFFPVRVFSFCVIPAFYPRSFVRLRFSGFFPRDRHRQTPSSVVRPAINSLERLYNLHLRRRRHERIEQSKSKRIPNILHTYVRILVVLLLVFARNEHSTNRTFHRYCHCSKKLRDNVPVKGVLSFISPEFLILPRTKQGSRISKCAYIRGSKMPECDTGGYCTVSRAS